MLPRFAAVTLLSAFASLLIVQEAVAAFSSELFHRGSGRRNVATQPVPSPQPSTEAFTPHCDDPDGNCGPTTSGNTGTR